MSTIDDAFGAPADAGAPRSEEAPVPTPATPLPSTRAPLLALLDVSERGGRLLAQRPITHWPVTIGRALSADLVVDDPHLAAEHLRIDHPAHGVPCVEVLDTANGIAVGRRRHQRGERFDWPVGEPLSLGRLHFTLRLAQSPVAPELPLPRFRWDLLGATVALLVAYLAVELGLISLDAAEPSAFARQLPASVLLLLGSLAAWSGLWALANKLFAHRLHFWRHLRIGCAGFLGARFAVGLANLLAFVFSWESLARFDTLVLVGVTALTVFVHLQVIAPQRRTLLALLLSGGLLVGVPAVLGTQWLQNKRLSSELHMASLFPPSWRVAPTVPVPEFISEAGMLRQRLDRRLKDADDSDAADDGEEGEDE